jgi:hypothetical protein
MSSPNLFNVLTNGSSGDHEIIPATPDEKVRVRQLNIQNQGSSSTSVSIKNQGNILIGPIVLPEGSLISLELTSEEYENFFVLSKNTSLVINVNTNEPVLVFGWSMRY